MMFLFFCKHFFRRQTSSDLYASILLLVANFVKLYRGHFFRYTYWFFQRYRKKTTKKRRENGINTISSNQNSMISYLFIYVDLWVTVATIKIHDCCYSAQNRFSFTVYRCTQLFPIYTLRFPSLQQWPICGAKYVRLY